MAATGQADQESPQKLGLLTRLGKLQGLGRALAISISVAAFLSGVATYAALAGTTPFGDSPGLVLLLLNLDLILLLLLAFLIVRRIVGVWSERRRGSAGSRLHVKLVVRFALASVAPAIIVGVFSVSFFNFGVESWFSDRVRTALSESLAAAEIYLQEHKRNIKSDVMAMARDLNRDVASIYSNPLRFNGAVKLQTSLRDLTEAIVFDNSGQILARAGLTYLLEFEPVPPQALATARSGEVALMTSGNDDRVRALVRLDGVEEVFLYVGRLVDPIVLGHMERTKGAVEQFEKLEIKRADLQINFALIFMVVGLLLLLAAVWMGLMFATQISGPVSALIAATENVRAGNLSVRVSEESATDEIGSLSRAFNRMTSELEGSRRELVEANMQLDERRQFTETVLEGVSAGVVGLDRDGRINLPNRSASELLGIELEEMIGHSLAEVVPEMLPLLRSAETSLSGKPIEGEIQLKRHHETRTLLIRISAEWVSGRISGFVVTFDDISQLLAAQRKAAWADVARRIAHEIKNPLTPIQLSAERLKRKYIGEIESDPDTFVNCTDTIIRHVEDIGRMVDEFSSFARLPVPTMREEDLTDICRQVVFLYRTGQPNVEFVTEVPTQPVMIFCDGRQIGQAITNLLKNAVEAIEAREGGGPPKGKVVLRLSVDERFARIEIEDNGKGLPLENRETLVDPYITTRSGGTGLGLAIVRKIMEDHGGHIVLEDGAEGGAVVRLAISRNLSPAESRTKDARVSGKIAHGV